MRSNYVAYITIPVVVILVFDPSTAARGVQDGLQMCLSSVIPALFPLLFFVGCLTESISGFTNPYFHRLFQAIGVPKGAEAVFILGLISGYPVGAQSVSNLYLNGSIDRSSAHRLMGFCNNAGPAFIFGMVASLFRSVGYVWLLWGIQILSTLVVAIILPGKKKTDCKYEHYSKCSVTEILGRSLKSMSMICGWVVIFRVITAFIEHWLEHYIPGNASVILQGFLELTNGCIALNNIESEAHRFVIISAFLSFGGLCVWLQVFTAAQNMGIGMFIEGKILQTAISTLLALLFQAILYTNNMAVFNFAFLIFACCAVIALICFSLYSKKTVAIQKFLLYNEHTDIGNEA